MAFVRIKNIPSINGNQYAYAYLVESYWNKEKQQSRQRVLHYIGKVKNMLPIVAKEIFERDGLQCVICKSWDNLTIDHIVPLSKEPNNHPSNLQTLCNNCNAKKGGDILPSLKEGVFPNKKDKKDVERNNFYW